MSWFGDYQARRANIRLPAGRGQGHRDLPHGQRLGAGLAPHDRGLPRDPPPPRRVGRRSSTCCGATSAAPTASRRRPDPRRRDPGGPHRARPLEDQVRTPPVMRRVWAWMALNFGKHAGDRRGRRPGGHAAARARDHPARVRHRAGLATSTRTTQVYKDSVAYQDLFGGQAMVSSSRWTRAPTSSTSSRPRTSPACGGRRASCAAPRASWPVVSPLTALQFTQNLVRPRVRRRHPERRRPGPARRHAARPRPGRAGPPARRRRHHAQPASAPSTPDQQTFDNPEWVRFLLYDNQGEIRKSLRPFFPDESHAQMVTRLVGNRRHRGGGRGQRAFMEVVGGRGLRRARRSPPPAPRSCSRTSTTTCGAACSRSAPSPWRS